MLTLSDPLLIVTDLDGSLLDHHTYQWQAAQPWLTRLHAAAIPLVICSSKTAAEIRPLQQQLGIPGAPFISENGAKLYHGINSNRVTSEQTTINYSLICHTLHQLRQRYHYRFTGFADVSNTQVAEWTGLSSAEAELARQREASESFLWQDTPAQLIQFAAHLQAAGLHLVQGGRFWHAMPVGCSKAQAINVLLNDYPPQTITISLGDGPNDVPMLESTNYAVVIRSHGTAAVTVQHIHPQQVYYTHYHGPQGWSEGLDHFICR